jgi:hypothetical protein
MDAFQAVVNNNRSSYCEKQLWHPVIKFVGCYKYSCAEDYANSTHYSVWRKFCVLLFRTHHLLRSIRSTSSSSDVYFKRKNLKVNVKIVKYFVRFLPGDLRFYIENFYCFLISFLTLLCRIFFFNFSTPCI